MKTIKLRNFARLCVTCIVCLSVALFSVLSMAAEQNYDPKDLADKFSLVSK
ncbi:hypothetical protein [Catenovulum maritimum]|uniref:hypothetical protein n=1 Tax=Catenovulum maritimum TaxID=1513271 RepID=UPI0012B5CC46|nr:hypothetical protein [Catenovulum maritimum]